MRFVPADLKKYQALLGIAAVVIVLMLMNKVEVNVGNDWIYGAAAVVIAYWFLFRKKPEKLYNDIHDLVLHVSDQEKYRPPYEPVVWENPVILPLGELFFIQPNPTEALTLIYDIHGVAKGRSHADIKEVIREFEASGIISGELKDKLREKTLKDKAAEAGYTLEKEEDEEIE